MHLLIDPSGHIQLLDLGVTPTPESFDVGYGGSPEEAISDRFRSLAPEQIAREGLSQRSNLFSFGVLLYEMFTGESPFRDTTPLGTASRILSLDPPWVNEINPQLDAALAALIDHLLAKEPGDRPASALAVSRELESIIHGGEDSQGLGNAVPSPSIEEQIERLYDEIITLTREAPTMGRSKARDEEIECAYARLRELQTAEAKRHRELFEAGLAMPIDAGAQILDRARALRKEIEDLAASDVTAEKTNAT